MSSGSAQQKVLAAIEKLPADATLEDAIEGLVLLAKTERGLTEVDAGKGKGRIASYKIPRHVIVVDGFPMTPSGKIRKVELRAQAKARLDRQP